MANLNCAATLTIQVNDITSSTVLLTRSAPGLLNALLTTLLSSMYAVAPTAAVDYELPMPNIGTVVAAYVRNSGSAGQLLTVKFTPSGGAKVTTIALQPGGCIFFFEPSIAGGITEIAVNPSANGVPFEYILLG